jgi:hypothetical protein
LFGERGFADLARPGEDDDFFRHIAPDVFFQISFHAAILNGTSKKSRHF